MTKHFKFGNILNSSLKKGGEGMKKNLIFIAIAATALAMANPNPNNNLTLTLSKEIRLLFEKKSFSVFEAEVTAYSKDPKQGTADGITATGLPVDVGIAAVDPKIVPLGSIIWVEGYGYAIAADTGGKIKGRRVDVFFKSTREALKFGRAKRKVKIIARPIRIAKK